MNKHAKLSPSSAYRWLKCGCSIHGPQEKTGSKFSQEGTRAHKLAELCLTGKLTDKDRETLCVDIHGVKSPGMLQHIKVYTDYIQTHIYKSYAIEEKVIINESCWGTADFIGETEKSLHVYDLKYGKVPVTAKDNPQLQIYATGAWIKRGRPNNKEVITHIVQPRVIRPVSSVSYNTSELQDIEKTINKRTVEIATDREANPGNHCKYCPVKTCKHSR